MKRFLLIAIILYSNFTSAQCVIVVNSSSCTGDQALIQITSGEIYDQYQWYFKPISSSGDFQPINSAINPSLTCDWSTYDQTLVKLECYYDGIQAYFSNTIQLDRTNCLLSTTINEQQLSDLILYPNPVHDYLLLSNSEELDYITIFNSIGQSIYTSQKPNLKKIDTSFLTSGVYILEAASGKKSKKIKFIKS